MEKYDVEVTFYDGTTVIIEVEAENESEAIEKAMPISFII
jgi:hypothetical protein